MKKRLWKMCVILLIMAMVFCGCSPAEAPEADGTRENQETPAEGMTAEAEALLEEALDNVDELETPVREYGEAYGFNQLDGDLMVHILYPVGEIEAMNTAIEGWIDEQATYYEADAKDYVRDDLKAELTVEYESRLIDEKLVSVQMEGWYEAPFMAHPIDIVKTFHGNLETGRLVELAELLEEGGAEVLQEMVTEDAGVDAALADDGLLNHWVLTAEGLEITLARGDHKPAADQSGRGD